MPSGDHWNGLNVLDPYGVHSYSGVIDSTNLWRQPDTGDGEVLWVPFDPEYMIQSSMGVYGQDACGDTSTQPIAADLVQFPEGKCPMCGEQGHDINAKDCKNPLVSIRSEFYGCRRCYDAKYTGLANRYLYDMCRLMGLEFDWLA